MSADYHLWVNEAAQGPFTIGQLRAMWNSGQITAETAYTTNAGQEWRSLAELAPTLEPSKPPPPLPTNDDSEYRCQLGCFLQKNWTVIAEGPSGAQLQAKKEMGGLTITCLIFGVLLLAVYGSGLVLIIAALIGHAFKRPATHFLSRNCTEKDRPQFMRPKNENGWDIVGMLFYSMLIIATLIVIYFIFMYFELK